MGRCRALEGRWYMASNCTETIPLVYLFYEGKTELGYLQSLAKNRAIRIVPMPSVSAPVILLERALMFAIESAEDLRDNQAADIWVVFDYDSKARDMAELRSVLSKCPSRCTDDCKIHDINQCEAKDVFGRIHVAFMSPCIEIWGILCTDEGARMDKLPDDRHELQKLLHKLMPRYDHKHGALFDVGGMTHTDDAIRRAKEWERTHGQFPECLNASHYAGIYPLVEKIIAAPCEDPKSWRRG